ncbi:MAG: hypothetical protein DI556_04015 [Rhodovulum sulfidophilum]|uniref:Uncharacterized protein n=1 Tax=Rhodovulum sulfidophilum TaxID=35806 RepID=A0A2W5NCV4_RHOSU|nr:MAG: hypothetical protein DI556_04015 [Rhodovulum sulfidophilum]
MAPRSRPRRPPARSGWAWRRPRNRRAPRRPGSREPGFPRRTASRRPARPPARGVSRRAGSGSGC